MADKAKDSKEIDKEIEDIATAMVKSVVDGKQVLFDTIMNLGPEGLKKALPTLTPEQQELVKQALAEMTKATHLPEVTQDASVLSPVHTKTKNAKLKTESLSGSDNQDEKLMQDKNKDIDHQGDHKVEGLESPVIKAKDIPHKGPNGGVIIGHTKDGKPIYEHAGHESHRDFSPSQHHDASESHLRISDKHHADKMNSPYASVSGLQSMGGDKKKFAEAQAQHAKDSGEHELHRESAAYHRRMADSKSGSPMDEVKPEDHQAQAERHLRRVDKLTEMRKCNYMAKGGEYGLSLSEDVTKSFDLEEVFLKSLFNENQKCVLSVPEETKQSCMYEIGYKLQEMKNLRDMSWMIEQDAPEAKEVMEKKFSKLKSEVRNLCEKHSSLKKAYENFMTQKSFKEVEENAKKEGAKDPKAVAAAVGIKKYGVEGMEAKAEAGKEKAMKKGEEMENQTAELTPEQKLEKKKMKKAKKIAKSIKKIVKFAKALGLSKDEVKKAIEAANGDLKVVKSEMKAKMNKEEDQVKIKTQDESAVTAPKPDQSKGDLEVKPDETADEALKKLPKVEKSIKYEMKSSIAANTLGRNTHWDVDSYIEKAEQEKQDTIKKGAYFGEKEVEALKKSETDKADINDLIEKGMDYSKDEITRIEGVRDHKRDAGAVKKSNYDVEIAASMGISKEEYEKIFGSNEN